MKEHRKRVVASEMLDAREEPKKMRTEGWVYDAMVTPTCHTEGLDLSLALLLLQPQQQQQSKYIFFSS